MMMMRPAAQGGALSTVTDHMFEAAVDCQICDKKFHAFRRKHRCRSCGHAVCGSCARTHKIMPSSMMARYGNEPVRVCDRCIQGQTQMMQERRRMEDIERARARQQIAIDEERHMREAEIMRRDQLLAEQRAREQSRRAMHLRALELKHFGPRTERSALRRCRSLDDCGRTPVPSVYQKELDVFINEAEKRSREILDIAGVKPMSATARPPTVTAAATVVREATIVPEAEECAICLDTMDVGNAIYTTACAHSFHWGCLKEIQSSDSSNADKCPACRAIMTEMQTKKQCDHPRVRLGHRFCRDCGSPVTERDAKPRPNEGPAPAPMNGTAPPPQPTSYRAGSHGALVRCPQCQIQMRVLPHMYNMRVACPSGHMFLVQVAGQNPGGPSGMGMSGRGRPPPRGAHSGYPGASYHRSANSYSEL